MSSNVMLTLKNILINGESEYTLDDLKKEIGLTTDKSLINFLLRFLKEEIECISYDEIMYEQTAIEIIYEYLNAFITEDRQCDLESVILRLKLLESHINKQLRRIKGNIKNQQEVPQFECDFWNTVSHLNNELLQLIRISTKYQGENGNYYLLEDVVHNIKNIYLLQEIANKFPKLILECNKDGESFFNVFLNFYLEIIKDEKTNVSDIIYYDMVMSLFLNNDHLKVNKKMKDVVASTIECINNSKMNKKDANQRIVFLNHLRKKLMKEEKYVLNIRELNNKYICNIIIPGEGIEAMENYFKALSDVYHDFTDKEVITIDPFGSLDLDDGISLEKLNNNNYLIGVYIADVSNYVPFNSSDDITALQRCETLYTTKGIITPMLPRELIQSQCSLLPNNMRKVIACFLEIEPDGNVKNHFFARGIIKTKSMLHFSYTEVDKILNKGCLDSNIFNTLNNLRIISNLGLFKQLETEDSTKVAAHMIVDKYMVLVNHVAALDARANGYPFLYRAHKTLKPNLIINNNPSLNILINDLSSSRDCESLKNMLCGCFSKAYYTTDCLPHEGLGLSAYAHTTSPLRRYSDLVNQRLIKKFLIDKSSDNSVIDQIENYLSEVADMLNSNQQISNHYVNDYAHILRK